MDRHMKMDVEVSADSPADVGVLSKKAEEYGFDCLWVNETKHDPFVQLALAVAETKSINVGTSIALAFTRSPTTLAYAAWDLQRLSSGRLILGLGTQVKGHIERRFGMKWEPPVPKMRDVVLAIRSVWRSWQTGEPLDYRGTHFKLDLMTPFFSPGPVESPRIPIYIAGVNGLMCRLSGELADGLHVHPLHTVRYLREVVHPALAKGLEKGKRKKEDVSVAASVFAAVGDTQEEIHSVREAYRGQIAFYASNEDIPRIDGAARMGGRQRQAARPLDDWGMGQDGRRGDGRHAGPVRRGGPVGRNRAGTEEQVRRLSGQGEAVPPVRRSREVARRAGRLQGLTLKHVRDIRLGGEVHNNKMERLNGEMRDREKVMRGLKRTDTPILKGYQIYHNFFRPHEGLNGDTPAERAGIKVEGENKWVTLIQNAAKK